MKPGVRKIGKLFEEYPDISIATYQRSLVWKDPQKAQFVRSVLNGFPTGVIVINKTNRPPVGPLPVRVPSLPDEPVHDVIDGQQRLTTIKNIVEDPFLYFTQWQTRPPRSSVVPETDDIRAVRTELNQLIPRLARRREGFVPQGTTRLELKRRIIAKAMELLREKRETRQVSDLRFKPLVDAIDSFIRAFASEQIMIAELDDFEQDRAEEIYRVINTTGTPLLWWELLSVDHAFSRTAYCSSDRYRTRYDDEVRRIAGDFRPSGHLRAQVTTNDSFWSALVAVGERFHREFSALNPQFVTRFVSSSDRRLKVDGLGFRLVSGFLSHQISTAAVRDLFTDYSPDQVRQAIDSLFDTATVLFGPRGASANGFGLFRKYSNFESPAIPAAPLMGIILAAARLVAINSAEDGARGLTAQDAVKLRCLTEEIFREALCTAKWAGSGDTKLRAWLDSHFAPVRSLNNPNRGVDYPGRIVQIRPTFDDGAWKELLDGLAPSGKSAVDRRSAFLHFWTQYLYDSRVPGCLPRGAVEFDHIVARQQGSGELTSHPLNLAAINRELNRSKRRQSFDRWEPQGAELASYKLQTLDDLRVRVGQRTGPDVDFLVYASSARLEEMITERKRVYSFAFTRLLPNWMDDGDQ